MSDVPLISRAMTLSNVEYRQRADPGSNRGRSCCSPHYRRIYSYVKHFLSSPPVEVGPGAPPPQRGHPPPYSGGF